MCVGYEVPVSGWCKKQFFLMVLNVYINSACCFLIPRFKRSGTLSSVSTTAGMARQSAGVKNNEKLRLLVLSDQQCICFLISRFKGSGTTSSVRTTAPMARQNAALAIRCCHGVSSCVIVQEAPVSINFGTLGVFHVKTIYLES